MATIEKRQNEKGEPVYRVRIRLRGTPKQSATFKKMLDAKNWAIHTESAIMQGRYFKTAESKRHTLSELITRYQKNVLPHKSTSQHFLSNQHNQLNWWKKQLGDYLLSEITRALIVEARGRLECGPSTVNRYMAALSHVFTVAVREWEWMETSPVSKISKLREPRGRVRYLSDEERNRLVSVMKSRGDKVLELIVILALSTGARKGELLKLRWQDVDFTRRSLVFNDTKNGERRAAALGDHALNMLQAHFHKGTPSKLVFPSERDTPVRIDREFKQLLLAAEIQDFRFHDLRHCTASYLAMNGATLNDIAHILGHKTLSMVKRYTHLSESHTSRVVTEMNAKIFNEANMI